MVIILSPQEKATEPHNGIEKRKEKVQGQKISSMIFHKLPP
jgi:hypothetical protein